MQTFIVMLIVLLAVIYLIKTIKNSGEGSSYCGCGCSSCSSASGCSEMEDKTES